MHIEGGLEVDLAAVVVREALAGLFDDGLGEQANLVVIQGGQARPGRFVAEGLLVVVVRDVGPTGAARVTGVLRLGRLFGRQLAHRVLLRARQDGRPGLDGGAVDVESPVGAGHPGDPAVVGEHRPRRAGIAEAEELRARIGEGAGTRGEFIEHLGEGLLFDASENLGGRSRQEEAVIDRGIRHPDAVQVGPVLRAPIIGDGVDGGVEGGETITDRKQRVLVADVQVGVGVLREGDGRAERNFGVDRGVEARRADGGPAEGQRGVLPWFEDFRPIVGATDDEFEAVRRRREARGHGAGADARGFRSGHGRGRIGVHEDREAERIAAPADAVVEDGEHLRWLSGAGEDGARRDDLGRGHAAAVGAAGVGAHRVGQKFGDFAADIVQRAIARVVRLHDAVAGPAGEEVTDIEGPRAADADRQGVGAVEHQGRLGGIQAVRVEATREVVTVDGRREAVERDRSRGEGEHPELARLKGDFRNVGTEALGPVGGRVGGLGQGEHVPRPGAAPAGAIAGEVHPPCRPSAVGEAHRRGVAGVFALKAHRDVVWIMQDGDGRQRQPERAAVVLQAPDEHLAGDIGGGPHFRRLGALVRRNVDVFGGVHAVVHVAVVRRAAIIVLQTDGVREVCPGAQGRRIRDGVGGVVPRHFLIEAMVVAQGFPGGAPDGGVVEAVRIERGDEVTAVRAAKGGTVILHVDLGVPISRAIQGALGVEGIRHATEGIAQRVLGRGAFAELTGPEFRVGLFEGDGEVDLQAAPLGVGVQAARNEGEVGPSFAGDRRRGGFREDARVEEAEVGQFGRPTVNPAQGDVLEALQNLDAGSTRAPQRHHLVVGLLVGADGGARGRRQARIREVEFRLHAFVADPVAVGARHVGVGQLHLGEEDATIGTTRGRRPVHEFGRHRRGIPNQRDHHGARRGRVIRLEGNPMVGFIIGLTEEVDALRVGRAVVPTADEPSGWLGGAIAPPDAGPQRVADRLPIPTWLVAVGAEVRLRGHASVGAGFLLEVGERQAERDERMQFALGPVLGGFRELGFNAQERRKNDDDHDHHRHDGEGKDEAEAASRRSVWCFTHLPGVVR